MKRLCFLSPDSDHTYQVVKDLKEYGIPEKHIYVIGKSDVVGQRDDRLEGLPDEGPEGDDFLDAYKRGLALGGTGGIFAGIYLMLVPTAGLVLGGGALLLIGLAGAGLGGLLSGIAGAAFHSSRLSEYEQALNQGAVLVLVDVPKNDVDRTEELIRRQDPEIEIEGSEASFNLLPD